MQEAMCWEAQAKGIFEEKKGKSMKMGEEQGHIPSCWEVKAGGRYPQEQANRRTTKGDPHVPISPTGNKFSKHQRKRVEGREGKKRKRKDEEEEEKKRWRKCRHIHITLEL